jgi:hypothetical protein
MTDLLSLFFNPLLPASSFLDLVAMATLRRRMQVLRKIWHEMPLPPPLVISFLSRFLLTSLLSVSGSSSPPLLSALLAPLLLVDPDRHLGPTPFFCLPPRRRLGF